MNKFMRTMFMVCGIASCQVQADFDINSMMAELRGDTHLNNGDFSQQIIDTSSQGFVSGITGDIDNLFQAIGEKRSDFELQEGSWPFFVGKFYWANDPENKVEEKCDKNGENCTRIYAKSLTTKEKKDKELKRVEGILRYYSTHYTNADQLIGQLSKDMQELQKEIQMFNNRKIEKSGENLKIELQNILLAAQVAKNTVLKKIEDQEYIHQLEMVSPEKGYLLEDGLEHINKSIELSRDKKTTDVLQKVKDYLLKISREVEMVKKTKPSIEDALEVIDLKIKRLEETHKFKTVKSKQYLDDKDFYNQVKAELNLEKAKRDKDLGEQDTLDDYAKNIIKNKSYDIFDRNKDVVQYLYVKTSDVREKIEKIIKDTQEKIEKIRKSIKTTTVKSTLEEKKKEIQQQESIIKILEKDLEYLEDIITAQNRKVDELIKKHGSITKALDYVKKEQDKLDPSGFISKAWDSLQNKPKLEGDEAAKKEKMVAENKVLIDLLEKRKKEETIKLKQNDPVYKSIDTLQKSSPADMYKSLEGVVIAVLGKAGVTMDKLDRATREKLASILKKHSDSLIDVVKKVDLPELDKVGQKQAIVKAMLSESKILLASFMTGASGAALETGDVHLIATDIALNKLVNSLVPAEISNDSLFDIDNLKL